MLLLPFLRLAERDLDDRDPARQKLGRTRERLGMIRTVSDSLSDAPPQ